MDNENKELKERILQKIEERIEDGKIPTKDSKKYFDDWEKEIKEKNKYINEFGILSEMAKDLGITVEGEEPIAQTTTELKIGELIDRINEINNDVITIKGKVMRAFIAKPPKKDKDGNKIEGQHYNIAKIDLADGTGFTQYSQFYSDALEELFGTVDDKTIIGKTMILKNIRVSQSIYSPYKTQVAFKKEDEGSIDFEDGEMDFEIPEYPVTLLADSPKGHNNFFLLKVTLEPKEGIQSNGNPWKIFNVVDSGDTFASVKCWFADSDKVDAKVGDLMLVEGTVKDEPYQGKVYKNINIWRKEQHVLVVNPEGYEFKKKRREVKQKSLMNAEVGDLIETNVLIKRFFPRKPYFLSCPVIMDPARDRACGKGINPQDNGTWKCNRPGDEAHVLNDEEAENANRNVVLKGEVTDGITMTFDLFDRGEYEGKDGNIVKSIVECITGKKKDEFIDEFNHLGKELFFERLNQSVTNQWYKIKATVAKDEYNGKIMLKAHKFELLDIDDEIENLKEDLKTIV